MARGCNTKGLSLSVHATLHCPHVRFSTACRVETSAQNSSSFNPTDDSTDDSSRDRPWKHTPVGITDNPSAPVGVRTHDYESPRSPRVLRKALQTLRVSMNAWNTTKACITQTAMAELARLRRSGSSVAARCQMRSIQALLGTLT